MSSTPSKEVFSPFLTGITCKCPACGKGKLFSGYIDVQPVCSECGQDLKSIDSGDGPAVFVIFIVGFVVIALCFWVQLAFRPPFWLQLLIWIPAILGLSLGLLKPLKGVMIALHYKHITSQQEAENQADETQADKETPDT
ncbi:DUF983 domain-containing protein [Sneathiella limimaris]|uniref:DUF983 domain-containing protein n=1 Tax=Sneathiella limimaris TaxID=1964213 RepID=UPI00146F7795|nr:DUF983 domain-containing protein [Sneathiella limimaris]